MKEKEEPITHEEALDLVASVEAMLDKEQRHLVYLEANKNKVSKLLDIQSMITSSKKHIQHFEMRIAQYKSAWNI